jgi:hypothetical protein
MRAGKGYKKIGRFPVSHHYLETVYFVFVGWVLQIVFPYVGLSGQKGLATVFTIIVALTVVLFAGQGRALKKYNLPKEPTWHSVLVIAILDVALLVGFFAPWPDI